MAELEDTINKTQEAGEEEQQKKLSWNFTAPDGTFLRQFQDATTSGDKWNAAIGAGIAGINGLTSIASNAMNAARIRETPEFDAQLNAIDTIGNADYGSYTQLLNGYQNLGYVPQQNYNTVRGMTNGQKWANAGSSILTGASTGMGIAGPFGALAGGVIGGIGSLIGIKQGDMNARLKTQTDNMNAQIAQNNANLNLATNLARIRDNNFRNKYANHDAYGGKIERKQVDIKDFANRVMNKPVSRIVRTKCKGGVMIKINK